LSSFKTEFPNTDVIDPIHGVFNGKTLETVPSEVFDVNSVESLQSFQFNTYEFAFAGLGLSGWSPSNISNRVNLVNSVIESGRAVEN
jgi:hypothetical protein